MLQMYEQSVNEISTHVNEISTHVNEISTHVNEISTQVTEVLGIQFHYQTFELFSTFVFATYSAW